MFVIADLQTIHNTQRASMFTTSPYQISHTQLQWFITYRLQTGKLKANATTVAILLFYISQKYDLKKLYTALTITQHFASQLEETYSIPGQSKWDL
jgi:hypothetical protein